MNVRNNKGITLMTEVITVVVFLLILGTITYSSISSIQVRALNNMYADILMIQEKAANYYLKYGEAPITGTNITPTCVSDQLNKNDDPNGYYKVDFNKLLNVSLNNKQTEADYYYINTKTLTVYYSKGVMIDNLNTDTKTTYYTLPSNKSEEIKVENYQ